MAWLTLSPQAPDQRDGPLWQLALYLDQFSATQWLTFNDLEFVANIGLFVPVGLFFVLLVGKRLQLVRGVSMMVLRFVSTR